MKSQFMVGLAHISQAAQIWLGTVKSRRDFVSPNHVSTLVFVFMTETYFSHHYFTDGNFNPSKI
jgi:hypothetical protein